jgi:hypothetical protein
LLRNWAKGTLPRKMIASVDIASKPDQHCYRRCKNRHLTKIGTPKLAPHTGFG